MAERSEYIHIRVTPEEVEQKNMTAYLLRMALHGYVLNLDLPELKEILRLLRISGNNLNQYAKQANATGSIYWSDIEELKHSQSEVLMEMRKLLDKLMTIV